MINVQGCKLARNGHAVSDGKDGILQHLNTKTTEETTPIQQWGTKHSGGGGGLCNNYEKRGNMNQQGRGHVFRKASSIIFTNCQQQEDPAQTQVLARKVLTETWLTTVLKVLPTGNILASALS